MSESVTITITITQEDLDETHVGLTPADVQPFFIELLQENYFQIILNNAVNWALTELERQEE